MPRATKTLLFLSLAAALLAIFGNATNNIWLLAICKPLATLLLLVLANQNWRRTKNPFAFWISLGLLFSLVGDILLLSPGKFFLPGLAAFLITHIAYLIAFTRDAKFPANWFAWLIFLTLAAGNFHLLHQHLPTGFALPVALYAIALATMSSQALGRSLLLQTAASKLAAAGALLFLLSDTVLGWDRFHKPIIPAPVLILSLYYAAQFLITLSTHSSASTDAPHSEV